MAFSDAFASSYSALTQGANSRFGMLMDMERLSMQAAEQRYLAHERARVQGIRDNLLKTYSDNPIVQMLGGDPDSLIQFGQATGLLQEAFKPESQRQRERLEERLAFGQGKANIAATREQTRTLAQQRKTLEAQEKQAAEARDMWSKMTSMFTGAQAAVESQAFKEQKAFQGVLSELDSKYGVRLAPKEWGRAVQLMRRSFAEFASSPEAASIAAFVGQDAMQQLGLDYAMGKLVSEYSPEPADPSFTGLPMLLPGGPPPPYGPALLARPPVPMGGAFGLAATAIGAVNEPMSAGGHGVLAGAERAAEFFSRGIGALLVGREKSGFDEMLVSRVNRYNEMREQQMRERGRAWQIEQILNPPPPDPFMVPMY